jgi:hypothetical protein
MYKKGEHFIAISKLVSNALLFSLDFFRLVHMNTCCKVFFSYLLSIVLLYYAT